MAAEARVRSLEMRSLPALVIAAVAGLFLVLVVALHRSAGERVPAQAPAFVLTDAGGREISLQSLRGKAVLVHFWATWCPPCVVEAPILEQLRSRYQGRELAIVAISVDEGWDVVDRFVRAKRLGYTVLLDPQRAVARRYGTEKFPESYLVDARGRVRRKYVGPQDWTSPEVLAEIDRVLNQD